MIKLAFCTCENKGADYFLYPTFQASGYLLWLHSPVCVSDLVGNPEDRFSHDAAHLVSAHFYKGPSFYVTRSSFSKYVHNCFLVIMTC